MAVLHLAVLFAVLYMDADFRLAEPMCLHPARRVHATASQWVSMCVF